MSQSITIERRFRGPPDSANGGYVCGQLAKFVGKSATVRLMAPPPLDTPVQVREADGYTWLYHETQAVARAQALAGLSMDIPAVPPADALESAQTNYRGNEEHFYPGCFVCGPNRDPGDGLRIFAGNIEDTPVVGACWTPDSSLGATGARVSDEYLWAALDCPGAYAFEPPATGAILLGELSAQIYASVRIGQSLRVIGWEIEQQGRKHFCGTALFDEHNQLIAAAKAIWIEIA
ncbi:MAG: hypothetical protein AAF385_07555 [Pseudomonadota bacterium]